MKPIEAHSTAAIKAKVTREEQAAAELGHTDFSRGTRGALTAVFLAVVLSVPVAQIVGLCRHPEQAASCGADFRDLAPAFAKIKAVRRPADAVRLLPPAGQIKAFEESWEQNSVVGGALLSPVQAALVHLGLGNEKAYLGRDGWLFYRPDVDYVTGPAFLDPRHLRARSLSAAAPQPDPRKAVLQFAAQLKERGIRLVLVPTPVKPMLEPERFSAAFGKDAPVLDNPSGAAFAAEMRAAGVLVFDAAGVLAQAKRAAGRPQYLETDTHWTPEAMQAAAAGLKDFIATHAPLESKPRPRYKRIPVKVSSLGDIAVMMKLPAAQTLYPKQEVTIQQVVLEEPQWRPDPGADVLLLGDSFSNIYSAEGMGWGEAAGLAEQLSFELGRPLDAMIRNDAGAHATREMLSGELARGRDRLAGKKLVVWQFAVRELSSGDWRTESTPMMLGPARESRFLQVAEGQSRIVTGVVREATSAPRPGTVTYLDHVIQAHLTDLEPADGRPLDADDALVAIYSMRNQVWTEAARYRPGQKVTLRLMNFAEVDRKAKVGSFKTSLLGGDLALETACWAEPVGAGTK
jgi:hypothetical protein